jgi:hypothetical protein
VSGPELPPGPLPPPPTFGPDGPLGPGGVRGARTNCGLQYRNYMFYEACVRGNRLSKIRLSLSSVGHFLSRIQGFQPHINNHML